jgi:VanZ family protein
VQFLLVWGPVVAFMALIFAASSSSDPGAVPGLVSDKILHFVTYGVLGLLMLRALAHRRLLDVTWRRALAAVVLSVLYGASDEIHQAFVPGRTPELADVAADAAGAAMGAAVLLLISHRLRSRTAMNARHG